MPSVWPKDAIRDRLIGDWYLWQRTGGHRTSTDDLLAAWMGVRMAGGVRPARYLDLGCGIGSVMLMVAHALRPGETVGIEAQQQSATMARRSVSELPDAPPIRVVDDDLRAVDSTSLGGDFELITGSPPYFPEGSGVVSPDPQRAACRFELRGGIEAYCAAAAACLSPEGSFAVVFQTTWDERVVAAGAAAGLYLRARADVRTRTDRAAPFLSMYGFSRQPGDKRSVEFATRDVRGELTAEYLAVRAELGLSEGRAAPAG